MTKPNTVTAAEAATILELPYSYIHPLLRGAMVPFTRNGRVFLYDRPTVEGLVGKFTTPKTTEDPQYEGWPNTQDVALRFGVTIEIVGSWVARGLLVPHMDKNGRRRFKPHDVDDFERPMSVVERRRLTMEQMNLLDTREGGNYVGCFSDQVLAAVHAGILPFQKVHGAYAFRREDLDIWQRDHGSALNRPLEKPVITVSAALQLLGLQCPHEVTNLVRDGVLTSVMLGKGKGVLHVRRSDVAIHAKKLDERRKKERMLTACDFHSKSRVDVFN